MFEIFIALAVGLILWQWIVLLAVLLLNFINGSARR